MRRFYRDPEPDPAGVLCGIWGDWRIHGLFRNPPPATDLYPSDPGAQRAAEEGYARGLAEPEFRQ